ncbi:helix-turn-helix domain-containing protein [Dactylosporangium sp. NPDC051541]|uniref:helix-turn-helix domain-containing protein n=1 Tax=Dactylosporangium sp. NPDC051541 TaxID=3363977 RepID=UPI00378D564C
MARWQPNAPQRLALAALELFEERGYDQTSVIDIAERAGLTKSTFFRHFRDKREVLFGGETMSDLVTAAIAGAPAAASPLEAVAAAMDAAGREAFTPERRDFSLRRRAVIAAHPELQERDALKGLAITAAMTTALERRGVAPLTATVTAQLASLAAAIAYERWSAPANTADYSTTARRALHEVRSAAAG